MPRSFLLSAPISRQLRKFCLWRGSAADSTLAHAMTKKPTPEVSHCVRTLRLKVMAESYAWLNGAAAEVNQVWNWANATAYKAARPFACPWRGLSAYVLDKLSAGAAAEFDYIGSDTIQRVNAEFATRRRQFKKVKLRWRMSRGARRSLGWVPFQAAQIKREG